MAEIDELRDSSMKKPEKSGSPENKPAPSESAENNETKTNTENTEAAENAGEAAAEAGSFKDKLKDGAVKTAKSGGKAAIKSGTDMAVNKLRNMDTGDDQTNEIQAQMNSEYDRLRDDYQLGKKIYDAQKKFRNQQSAQASEKAAEGAVDGAATGEATGTAAAQAGTAEAAGAAGSAAAGGAAGSAAGGAAAGAAGGAAAAGGGTTGGIAALFGTPVGWIILVIILAILLIIGIFAWQKHVENENVRNGLYTDQYENSDHPEIMQTWMGVYYQKYSEMSVYAMVDTSALTDGNSDVCGDHGNGADVEAGGDSGIDACSGESFKQLTGVDLGSISQSELYQQGTEKWAELKIADTDNKEKYLGVSAGALSQMDKALNNSYFNTSQLIKPVYSSCAENFEEFMADDGNDVDGDGKVTIKDCQIRKYDEDGKPSEITPSKDSDDGVIKADTSLPAWADHTLYLSYAKSTAFDYQDDANSSAKVKQPGNEEETAEPETPEDGEESPEEESAEDELKEVGTWDYGLGTMAHYVAVYQPSRINDYFVDDIQYICSADGQSKGVSVPQCAGHKFGDVVVAKDPSHKGSVDTSPIESIYADAYVPATSLYYREWHKYAEQYNNKINEATDYNKSVYGGSQGEYRVAGLPKEDWEFEPGVSTGVPQTEVKYVIDYALTFAGAVKFNITQKWITESIAEHTQYLSYSDLNTDLAPVTDPFPEVGSNLGALPRGDFHAERFLYYNGTAKSNGWSTGKYLVWKETGERTYTTIEKYTVTESIWNEKTGKYEDKQVEKEREVVHEVPAHFEDPATGDMYKYGELVGSAFDDEALKAMKTTSDNKDAYKWGASVSATISIHKQGDLQTYAVQYNSQTPTVAQTVGTDYLKQYLREYESFIPDPQNNENKWKCYETNTYLDRSQAANFETAAQVYAGSFVSENSYTYGEGLNSYDGEAKTFCYAESDTEAIDTLDLDHIPLVQFSSMAGHMGFTNSSTTGEDEEAAEYAPNQIKTNAGQSTDNHLMETLVKTDYYGNTIADIVSTFSGQYGVDSRLLAMIIAEENSSTGNVTGIAPGDYIAYNLSTRARTTEHMGGSYSSEDTQSLSESILSFFKNLFSQEKAGGITVGAGSKETITATKESLEKGGMLIDNGGTLTLETFEEGEQEAESETKDAMITRAAAIYNFYKNAGYSNVQCAAILGNLQAISAMKGEYVEGWPTDSDRWDRATLLEYSEKQKRTCMGIGLWKWMDERAIALVDYSEEKDIDWRDASLQMDFSISKDTDTTLKEWKGVEEESIADAVAFIVNNINKPVNPSSAIQKRIQYANDWYEKIVNGSLEAAEEEEEAHISTLNIDNADYKWDPTDPLYGVNPTADGDSLLNKVPEDDFGKITEIKVYQINNAVVAKNAAGEEKVMICASGIDFDDGSLFDYSINYGGVHTIKSEYMINHWHTLNGSVTEETPDGHEYTPVAIRIHKDILFHSVPYCSKSRNSLETGAYEKLGTASSHGCIRMALGDLCWLFNHIDADVTTAEIIKEEYDGEVPPYVTYDKAVLAEDSGDDGDSSDPLNPYASLGSSAHVERLSGAAVSVKVAAMHIQGLQVKYDYNMPMVMTAYGLGEDFLEAVLGVYEKETGIDRETAIANTLDTAWADYRKEVYENHEKYHVTLPSGRTYDYVERLLSRLPAGGGIKYQKIDTRYADETKEENTAVDATMHTVGTWYINECYDSLADSNNTLSRTSEANLIRAWRLLVKEGKKGTITEDQWKDITMGLVKYPEGVYNINDPSTLYNKDIDYLHLAPALAESAINDLIEHMMTFGTDATVGEEDYISSDFWKSHFSSMLGDGTIPWTSTMSAKDLFGNEENGQPVNYYGLTDTGVLVVRPYGYITDKYGKREYSDSVTYQDLEKTSGKVYSPFDGKILTTGEAKDGHFVYIRLTPPNGREDLMIIISGLDEVSISEGDKTGPMLGKSDENGMFKVAFTINGEFVDYEDIVAAIMATAEHDDEGVIGYVGSLAGEGGGGAGSLTYNGIPNITVPASLDGITWKDMFGPDAPHQPGQYAGHETWLNSGIYMTSGSGGDVNLPYEDEGKPIYAPVDGWIAICDDQGGVNMGKANYAVYAFKGADNYYYTIMIWHIQNGSCSAYAAGGGVRKKGDVIASFGNTGISYGAHAHVFMNRMSTAYNPGDSSNIFTRIVCNGSTPQPCAVKMNALFNW